MLRSSQNIEQYKTSKPISIPIKQEKKTKNYELTRNLFNPDKLSPPNSWNSRLHDRFYGASKSTFLE